MLQIWESHVRNSIAALCVCVWTAYRLVKPGFHMVCDMFFPSHAQELLVLFIRGYIYVHVNMT